MPTVLSGCVQDVGRNQMADGYLAGFSGGRVEVASTGSGPAGRVNAVAAMTEVGIGTAARQPKMLPLDGTRRSDVVVATGCRDSFPVPPRNRIQDGELTDPAGREPAQVRPSRDGIRRRVVTLPGELGAPLRPPS